jgi:hypothetical protein
MYLPMLVSAQLSVTFTTTSPACNGWTNGSVTANVSGGTQPYTYAWSNGFSGPSIQGIGAGNYSVTVTDANGTKGSGTVTLAQPDPLAVSISLSNVCSGNGNATATVTGGTGAYTYAWDNGAASASVTGLSSGLHCLTVTDAKGCQKVACVTVPAKMVLNLYVQGLACFNFCDASVEAIVTGGAGPFTYSWSNGANGSVNENLGPGDYSVTVTDANGCTVSGTATVGNPVQINIQFSVTNPACGSGGTGSVTATVSGGVAPHSYLWSTGATSSSVSGLAPGTYSLTVTDFLGCTESKSVSIIEVSDLHISLQATASSGCGAYDGTASVTTSGGTAPFTYKWSTGASTASISGLAPGTYGVTVTDANGCGASNQITVSGTPAIMMMIMGVNSGCAANGSANAMVTPGSGTPPFSYLWNTGATTSIINNLSPGTYKVTVTDAAGCTKTDQVTVTGSANLSVSTSGTNVSCYGGTNGSAKATASGGSGNYSYIWSNSATGATVTGLAAGTYFVTTTDAASGCTAMINVFISQPTKLTVTANGSGIGCGSSTGSASASASGGTSPYTYAWSNGATGASVSGLAVGSYTVTATDANGCKETATASVASDGSGISITIQITHPVTTAGWDGAVTAQAAGGNPPYTYLWSTGSMSQSISGLQGGSYSLTVTDIKGCSATAKVDLVGPTCLGDRIWNDVNRNGCQDPGEFGMGGIKVKLTGTDINGNAVSKTKTTAPNGQYLFDDLLPGNYQLQLELPAGYSVSPANACTDDFGDSDFDASGKTGTITLIAGQCSIIQDGGIYDNCLNISTPGTICCNQTLCGPGNDPAPITSETPASGGGSAVQYLWMSSEEDVPFDPSTYWAPIPGATGASYDPGVLYKTTYFIRCAKAADCTDWLESNVVTVTIDDVAYAGITGESVVCVGKPNTYTAYNNGPGATYAWTFGDWSTPSTSTAQSVSVTWNTAGVVNITLTVNANGCVSSNKQRVVISDSPVFCGTPFLIFTDNMENAVMIEWNVEKMAGNYQFAVQRSDDGVEFDDIAIMEQTKEEGAQHYAFADYFPKAGNAFYRLEILQDGQHLMYSNTERVQRFSNAEHFILYPNPVGNHLTIESSDEVQTAVQMEIFTMEGKLLQQVKLPEGTTNYPADFSQLQSGNYLIRFTYNNGVKEVMKFVKE